MTTTVESGIRARTRRAILDAAANILPGDSSASLGQIADAAGVGRTTLHRYFPERVDLIKALARHVMEQSDACVERASPDAGDPVDALRRVAEEMFDLGPVLTYLYSEPLLEQDTEFWASMSNGNDPLDQILDRATDLLRPRLSRAWVRRSFWALLYTGWESAAEDATPRYEVIDAIVTTFTRGVLVER